MRTKVPKLRTVIAETTKSLTIGDAIRALTRAESGGATHAKLVIQWKQEVERTRPGARP